MWELQNHTPFAAASAITIDKHGEKHWVVVVKGTFRIGAGGFLDVADQQDEPRLAPEYRGAEGESSLLYEQDLIAAKPRTDLYLNATAYAPRGQPCNELAVGLRTPRGQKALLIRGDQTWERNLVRQLVPTPPRPFVQMPITYERAYGGYDREDPEPSKHRLDRRNPVGTGFCTSAAHRAGKSLPNVQLPGEPLEKGPGGFGALCSYWEPRIRYQGTYDEQWVKTQKPLLPVDYDSQFLQCAPTDQQFEPPLRGGERLALVNLTPSGVLQLDLPKRYFSFATHIGQRRLAHHARLNTVIVEPDHSRLIMVWHSTLSCHRDIDDIDFTRIIEKPYV
ncbi:DUF2169 domain-containing protein [Pyxidicoccus parkwayensis]|uniref:DUF2169 domain-containing protein n=1 Tax=Pyxidicoccus parkwayensis TaxID=2813578 RepID=A0ABX7NT63_9BACT|nr:DUF2169 domain-containing protein [Pyxidicoccus parkwaysis]QSQ22082.1 DUF2169 domain-containing protein [Pyxidicoccus parkwaysis]